MLLVVNFKSNCFYYNCYITSLHINKPLSLSLSLSLSHTTDEVNKRRLHLSFDKCARLHINPESQVKSDVKVFEDVSIDQ